MHCEAKSLGRLGTQKYFSVFQGFGGKGLLASYFSHQLVDTGSYTKIHPPGNCGRLD
jgi:hypothetical protein